MTNKTISFISEHINETEFIYAVWSNPRTGPVSKITARPIQLKEKVYIQFSTLKENKEYHYNIEKKEIEEIENYIKAHCSTFKQLQIFTSTMDYQLLINKKGEAHIKKNPPSKKLADNIDHNKQKKYILDNKTSEAFLIELGIMTHDGTIKPSKYDKYKQINKYLEIIKTVIDDLKGSINHKPIRIIDFGCGKSYLTFAMYHYLHHILNIDVDIVGLDLKKDVIELCNNLSKRLGYTNLSFEVGDIGQYVTDKEIDIVVSLHACNTATDIAIAKGISWNAKAILAVPCCHHECFTQISNETLKPVLKHGILKEKVAALITDGLRATLLEALGYKVNVMEFIDMQHTPKNILLKAIKKEGVKFNYQAYIQYKKLSDELGLSLSLEKMLDMQKYMEK